MQAHTVLLKCQGECTKEVLLWQNMGQTIHYINVRSRTTSRYGDFKATIYNPNEGTKYRKMLCDRS